MCWLGFGAFDNPTNGPEEKYPCHQYSRYRQKRQNSFNWLHNSNAKISPIIACTIATVCTQSRYRRFSLAPWHPSGLLNFTLRSMYIYTYSETVHLVRDCPNSIMWSTHTYAYCQSPRFQSYTHHPPPPYHHIIISITATCIAQPPNLLTSITLSNSQVHLILPCCVSTLPDLDSSSTDFKSKFVLEPQQNCSALCKTIAHTCRLLILEISFLREVVSQSCDAPRHRRS